MQYQKPDFIPPYIKQGQNKKRTNFLGISLALFLAVAAFFSGFQMGNIFPKEGQSASLFSFFASANKGELETKRDADLEEFWKVWDLLDKKFAFSSSTQKISSEDRINGAIQGMVKAQGDPYTTFMPPALSSEFNEEISGNFSGVGMEVGIRNGLLTIIAPLPETPAEKAGILSSDIILKIDGVSTEDMSTDEAVHLIRGEKGTKVVLSIYREGALEIKDYEIVRDNIVIPTTKYEQIDDTFVVQLYSFNAVAETEIKKALTEYKNSNAKSLILDLRGNPGGFLQSSIAIAGFFLPNGKVVVREYFSDKEEEKLYRNTKKNNIYNLNPKNFVVLVDGGSASASEILAGALKEHSVATVIGVNTFGKGSVQELVNLPSGASLKVTIARWLTPNGLSISEGGLEPDIIINRSVVERLEGEDPQLEAGLRFLKGEKVESELGERNKLFLEE